MKIIVINNLYPPYNKGGAETIAVKMVGDLKALGHQLKVISSSPKASYQENDIYYIKSDYQSLKDKNTTQKLLSYLRSNQSREIKEILRKEKPDLVITHNLLGLGCRTAKIIKQLNIKHRHYLHDIQLLHPSGLMYYKQEDIIDSLPAKAYQNINQKYFRNCDEVVSPSKWLIELHQAKGFFKNSKIIIKRPEIILDKIAVEKDKGLVLFVGQLERHKGLESLIEAFGPLQNIRLEIVGDGTLKGHDTSNIKFLGRPSHEEALRKMAQAKLLIVPSICYENFPTVILEAKALGTKVIGSRLGGIKELLEDNEMFSPGDIEDIRKKIQENI